MKVIICENALDTSSWVEHEVEDPLALIREQLPTWPRGGRIYNGQVATTLDVTPTTPEEIERLREVEGPLYVVVYPEGPVALVFFAFVAVVAIAAIAFMAVAQPPTPTIRNTQASSPNNELSARTNRGRPGGRVPEILGTVRSTPDLLSAPVTTFVDHRERELAYMCIGRGSYDVSDVRDGETPLAAIRGSAARFFGPGTSPNSGSPFLEIGPDITDPVINARRSNAVNGQTLIFPMDPPSFSRMTVTYPNKVVSGITDEGKGFSFEPLDGIEPGDTVTFNSVVYTGGGHTITLTGTYTIANKETGGFGGSILTLDNPAAIDSDWNLVDDYWPDGSPPPTSGTMTGNIDEWVGPFFLDIPSLTEVWTNVVAPNGMYLDDGDTQQSTQVAFELECTPCNAAGVATGSPETFDAYVVGSALTRDQRATTLKVTPTVGGRQLVRMRRLTEENTTFAGSVVDEIKWRDLYGISPVDQTDFGDVTTVQTMTISTEGALSVKERKLNCLVTRKLPQRVSGSTFSSTLYPTNRADDIISWLCLDELIGNRPASQIDFDSIYDTIAEVETYFGTEKAVEFSYTFDKDNLSFEETVSTVANAVYCTAYRRGSMIKLFFEKDTPDSTLLLNHRNKLPGSETRTVRFGNQNNHDGVSFNYVDPADDAIVTYYIPEDQSALNPRKVESVGVRGRLQAHFHAWRLWNKIRYQNTLVDLKATQEADVLLVGERTLIADNTRSGVQDGEVLSQSSLELRLSQAAVLNKVPRSEELDHADWTKTNAPVTANAATNPRGATTADKAIPSTGSAAHNQYRDVTTVAGATNCWSVCFKADGRRRVALRLGNTGDTNYVQAIFDLVDGTIVTAAANTGTATGATAAIEDLGGGWWRCSIAGAVPTITTLRAAMHWLSDASAFTWANTGSNGILMWGAQVNMGSTPLHYERTSSAVWTIYLQLYDGTVETRTIVSGADPYRVILNTAPTLSLTLGDNAFARTTYMIVSDAPTRSAAFIVSQKGAYSNSTIPIQAINYDARYYSNDQDFVDEIVGEDGYVI